MKGKSGQTLSVKGNRPSQNGKTTPQILAQQTTRKPVIERLLASYLPLSDETALV
jgi:hypothetical protein